jgi:hypothetical protein
MHDERWTQDALIGVAAESTLSQQQEEARRLEKVREGQRRPDKAREG